MNLSISIFFFFFQITNITRFLKIQYDLAFPWTQKIVMSKSSSTSDILYQSPQGGMKGVVFRDIVFSSYAPDGGLYVPEKIPVVTREILQQWSVLSFPKLCAKILSLFVDEICSSAFEHFHHSENRPSEESGSIICGGGISWADIGF
ncbi:hypothetical protein RFI_31135 [Reticulomyxa filosa]|uniref:Threonine synthase N-terminal domain-containing protein n=1 Tax=Reticulomyxa filosa TaxID=46433 RepID=X6LYM1_RETFI|nr:hypothetical protein RFI_31135 [Reticulomyxa filosa]|eukprot:ETO06262.1 hypothetical protein RFI_31135 [Reticulomyxa filosa]